MFTLEKEEADTLVTKGILLDTLLHYTDDFLLPRMQDLIVSTVSPIITDAISKNNAVLVHMLKDYVDRKDIQVKDDIFSRLERQGVLPKRV